MIAARWSLVEPKIEIRLLISKFLPMHTDGQEQDSPRSTQNAGSSVTRMSSVGAAKVMESNRSSIPPWPGRRFP